MKRSKYVRIEYWICIAVLAFYLILLAVFLIAKVEQRAPLDEYLFEGMQFVAVPLAMAILFTNYFSKASRDSLEDFQRAIDKAREVLSNGEGWSQMESTELEMKIELLASHFRSALLALEGVSTPRNLLIAQLEHRALMVQMSQISLELVLLEKLELFYKEGVKEGNKLGSLGLILKFTRPEKFPLNNRKMFEKLTNEDMQFFVYGSGQRVVDTWWTS